MPCRVRKEVWFQPPAGARKGQVEIIIMSFSDTLKSLVDKDFLPYRARKGAHIVGDQCRMPCRVMKEVWLELPAGASIRKKENTPLLLFVLRFQNTGLSHFLSVKLNLSVASCTKKRRPGLILYASLINDKGFIN